MRRLTILWAGLVLCGWAARVTAATWAIDPGHTTIGFSVRHMMITNVRGHFNQFAATTVVDAMKPDATKLEATIQAASIDTNNDKRDEHLRSPDFFDVAKFPQITFTSFKIDKTGEQQWKVFGNLTLHGVTKPVELLFEGPSKIIRDPAGLYRTGGRATVTINRKDYGINFDKQLDGGGVLVGDEVAVTIEVEATSK